MPDLSPAQHVKITFVFLATEFIRCAQGAMEATQTKKSVAITRIATLFYMAL